MLEGLAASMLAGLAKARHPATKAAAKAASQAPAQREGCRKRSCDAGKPAPIVAKVSTTWALGGKLASIFEFYTKF